MAKTVKIAAMAGLALLMLAGQAGASERLTVVRNGMMRVALPAAAGSVIVANPGIADVNVVDSRTIYVIGRGFGSSAVTILDRAGRPIFDGQIVVTAGQRDSVMMYKGSKPSVMVCSNVCQPADDDSNSGGGSSGAQAFAGPAGLIAAPAAAAAAAPTLSAAMPGAASALTQ